MSPFKVALLTLVLLCTCGFAAAQEAEIELQIGDTLEFGECTGTSYTYMDLYVKTRFELDSISYDSINGWEFYNRFFSTGDFDVSRVPCSYAGQNAVIKHFMAGQNEAGEAVNVVVVMIRDGKSVAWVMEEAFLRGEAYFHSSP